MTRRILSISYFFPKLPGRVQLKTQMTDLGDKLNTHLGVSNVR